MNDKVYQALIKLCVDICNFYVYYRIDEEAKQVYIMNVIYSRRDQLR